MPNAIAELHDAPETTAHAVANFVDAAQQAFGDDLRSVVLYGSGAEGRLRASSDVNLLLVLSAFDRRKGARKQSTSSSISSGARELPYRIAAKAARLFSSNPRSR